MDADCMQSRRRKTSTPREKRWSVNSERLEAIVAELMKPIGDIRHSFDTDLFALLEEYLTEAGLRALEDGEQAGPSSGPTSTEHSGTVVPNFAEVALLLQQLASLYGRKVDFLYQYVIDVSDSLHNGTADRVASPEEPQAAVGSRRRRAVVTPGELHLEEFVPIELEGCSTARRDAEPSRPPPTLPRLYLQLEPRVPTAADAQLLDYQGEPIGLLPDFNVAWRLQNGLLVEDLCQTESGEVASATLRTPPLAELQATLEAGAPPELPEPLRCSTPLPEPEAEPEPADEGLPRPLGLLDITGIIDTTPKRRERKRKRTASLADLVDHTTIKLIISAEAQSRLQEIEEFSLANSWIRRVVDSRKKRVLSMRRKLCSPFSPPHQSEFRGYHISPLDIGGFLGWSRNEVAVAQLAVQKRAEESDDDGFFEQSSLSEDNGDESAQISAEITSVQAANAKWSAWQDQVLQRAARQEAQIVDIQAAAGRVLLHVQKECARRKRDMFLNGLTHTPLENGHVLNDILLNGHAELMIGNTENGLINGHGLHSLENGHVLNDSLENGHVLNDSLENGHVLDVSLENGHVHDNSLVNGHVSPECASEDAVSCSRLLSIAEHETDVSRLFLASLFLANAGNIEIVQGSPLTMNTFSVRLLSTDERLYRTVTAADEQLLR